MANTFGPLLKPLADGWNYILNDQTLNSLNEFKGGYGVQNGWHVKYLRSERDQVNNQYLSLEKRWKQEPELLDLAGDNILRLTVFSGFERLFAVRQALQVLKHRFVLPTADMSTLGEIFNGGMRNGYFKGALLNAVQFLGVNYNTLLWARGSDFTTQLVFSSAFETVFHPLDSAKTLLYADTQGKYKGLLDVVGKVSTEQHWLQLYRGLSCKLMYNAFFMLHLRNMYDNNYLQYVTTPLWFVSYGFLALKTRLQVAGTQLAYNQDVLKGAEKGLFRGAIPFLLVNYLFSYQLFGLYSQKAQDNATGKLQGQLASFKSPLPDNNWSR